MEMRLPIYNGKEVEKEYRAEEYSVMFGTAEDIISLFDIEKLASVDDRELAKAVAVAIPKAIGMLKPLLKEIFDGLTDDEIRRCKVADVARVVVGVSKFTMKQIVGGNRSKN